MTENVETIRRKATIPTPEAVAATLAVAYDVISPRHGRTGPFASLHGATVAATNLVLAETPDAWTRAVDLVDRREIEIDHGIGAWVGSGICVEISAPSLVGVHDATTGWYHRGVPADEMAPDARAWAVEMLRVQYGAARDAWSNLAAETVALVAGHNPACYDHSIVPGETACERCTAARSTDTSPAVPPADARTDIDIDMRIVSFGYGHGPAPIADLTYDLRRGFRNPHADPTMRAMTGLDHPVYDHVLVTPGIELVARSAADLAADLRIELAGGPITVAAGCVGGRHRSVGLARRVAELLTKRGAVVELIHRDVHWPLMDDNRHTASAAPGR
ncbi:hypothetical protein [Embleya sp. NPDC059259]|uniref:RapZ C-terminal domain-containing protein n=1 Tax=unclassified Embleya TaxID=2699296 RepID=UPI0036CFB9CC